MLEQHLKSQYIMDIHFFFFTVLVFTSSTWLCKIVACCMQDSQEYQLL